MNGKAGGGSGPRCASRGRRRGGVRGRVGGARPGACSVRVTVMDASDRHLSSPFCTRWPPPRWAGGHRVSQSARFSAASETPAVALVEVTGVDPDQHEVSFTSVTGGRRRRPTTTWCWATGVEQSYWAAAGAHARRGGWRLADRRDGHPCAAPRRHWRSPSSSPSPSKHRDLLTFVLVGAGPTGWGDGGCDRRDAARAISAPSSPRRSRLGAHHPGRGGPARASTSFSESLAQRARDRAHLEGAWKSAPACGSRGSTPRESSSPASASRAASCLWTAGVKNRRRRVAGSRAESDHSGRVRVQPDLIRRRAGPEVFVVGDTSFLEHDGRPLPGVARWRSSRGASAARVIAGRLAGAAAPAPFRYFDEGNVAVIGRGFAILESGRLELWSAGGSRGR